MLNLYSSGLVESDMPEPKIYGSSSYIILTSFFWTTPVENSTLQITVKADDWMTEKLFSWQNEVQFKFPTKRK